MLNKFFSLYKNGEIIDMVYCGNNNYMISVNIGSQKHKVKSYCHVVTDENGITVMNTNLGNEIRNGNIENIILVRNPELGFYIYNLNENCRKSFYFYNLDFFEVDGKTFIGMNDFIKSRLGKISASLYSVLDENGNFITDITDIYSGRVYNVISSEIEYNNLKQIIFNDINSIEQNDNFSLCKKLLKNNKNDN